MQKVRGLLDLINKYKAFFFDMDGVFWNGEQPIQGAKEAYQSLKKAGKQIFFITNNSSRSRESYVNRLKDFGIDTDKEFVFAASSIAAEYLKNQLPFVKKCYVVGMTGICEELKEAGIDFQWATEHNENIQMDSERFRNLKLDPEVKAVVCGIDYCFNYQKLCYASSYIQKGSQFIATNEDQYIKVGEMKMPGGGSCVQAIAIACGERPYNTGKPNPFVVNMLCKKYAIKKEDSIMIGDNMSTDILLGLNAGISTLLVLTGVTNEDEMKQKSEQGIIPTYYADSL